MATVLEIEDLSTHIQLTKSVVQAVGNVSLTVDAGETLGIVGESGCGKSMTGLSIMGLLPPGGSIVGGSIKLAGRELVGIRPEELRQIRGNEIAMIFQDPLTSLDPTKTIGYQVAEPVRLHRGASKARGPRAGGRGALPGRPAPAEGTARRVPAPALGRDASARDDRDGAGVRAEAADRRRADDRARRHHPGADPRADRRPQGAAGHGDLLVTHDMGVDRRARRPGERDVRGQGRGDGDGGELFATCGTRTPRPCSRRCRSSTRTQGALHAIPGLPPDLVEPACGLPVRAAVHGARPTVPQPKSRRWSARPARTCSRAGTRFRPAGTREDPVRRPDADSIGLAAPVRGGFVADVPIEVPAASAIRRSRSPTARRARRWGGRGDRSDGNRFLTSQPGQGVPGQVGRDPAAQGRQRCTPCPTCRSTSARARPSVSSASPAAARRRSAGC